ncbi:DUF21 domain-containing protein [Flavobacterium sp. Sd200]|uniref:hemolysin family protein n=1 Tax=Flavobacterium sp. Sd200 TaxID=2692211 RepID=UPI001370943F|nr:CNNM domain-containing protein [Flavobacterium sp. Sd200]MXN92219.1 DUF21 domain-containing protein [Flavobacterium sp. Sd200]
MEAAIIIGCLLLSAFFSGMEIAYVASNKVYLSIEKRQSTVISKFLTRLTQNPSQFLTSMLVGNSIVLVIYGYHMGNVTLRWLAGAGFYLPNVWQFIVQAILSVFIILVTAEFIPKVLFQVYANTLIKALTVPAYFFYMLFYSFSKAVMKVSDFILVKLFNTGADTRKDLFSRHELDDYLKEQLTGDNKQEEVDAEIQIFKNALDFPNLTASEIMTNRKDIAAIDAGNTVAGLKQLFIDTGYSKIVIYKEDLDNIIGYVDSFSLFKKPQTIEEVMISIEHVTSTIYIKDLLTQLTHKKKSMAVVQDDNAITLGIITVEDIIEELFGEIEDEHDNE